MLLKSVASLLLLIAFSVAGKAQIKDYNIKFQVKGAGEKDTVYLANYYGKALYYFDTAYVGKNGAFAFKKKKDLKPGIFAVVLKNSSMFELVINEPTFLVSSDTSNLDANTKFEGSPENTLFKEYRNFMVERNKEASVWRTQMDSAKTDADKELYKSKLVKLDTDVKAYQKKVATENPGTFVGQMVNMLVEVTIPDAPKDAKGNLIDSTWTYYYYRDHYFDNTNVKNDFLVNCPIFHNKLDYFFKQVVLQNPDTIVEQTRLLANKMAPKGEMFKYTVNTVQEMYSKSELMGMDAVFVGLADEFYLSGRAYWIDSTRFHKIDSFVTNIRPLLIGKQAIPLSLADTTHKNWLKLYDEKSEFTVLVFWEPTCGHCKKEMPILAEKFNRTGGKEFGVYAVSSHSDDSWKQFIRDNKMNFTNVAIPAEIKRDQDALYKLVMAGKTDERSLNYNDTYDVFSTPKVFILNKEKKIVAKQISIEALDDILETLRAIEKSSKKS